MNHAAGVAGRKRGSSAVWFLSRLLLAIVFLWAGSAKLLAPPEVFADGLAAFRMLPGWLVSPVALALPPFEILIGLALATGRPPRLGAFCALVLSAVFLAVLIAARARGLAVDCGCFGAGASPLPLTAARRVWFDLGRDLVLSVAALGLYRHQLAASRPVATP